MASSSCTFTDATSTVQCTAEIWYFAQATDASSSFPAEDWQAVITVVDSAGNSDSSSTASGVELNTLLAIHVPSSTIDYGTVDPNTDTGSVNQEVPVWNVGNASTSLKLSGTAMSSGSHTIATSSQHYATTTFTYGGNEQVLTDVPTLVSGFSLPAPTSTATVEGSTFWGIGVPGGTAKGIYTGVNTFEAKFEP
ncbi:hypothetical protein D6833_00970 [Candidatus Parcubacteria bacterium]|nr:MAG: hypothetical protein D6833_00970 [Candidatus Parcubacteria bacterium]